VRASWKLLGFFQTDDCQYLQNAKWITDTRPTGQPTSAPSTYLQAFVKVSMEQSFTTTLTPAAFNADDAAQNAFATIMETKLGDGNTVIVTGSNDGTRRNLRSKEEKQSEPILENEQEIRRKLTGTLVVEYDVTVQVASADDAAVTSVINALGATVTAGGFESTIGSELVSAVPSLPSMIPVAPVAPTLASASIVVTQSHAPTPSPTKYELIITPVDDSVFYISMGAGVIICIIAYILHHYEMEKKRLKAITPKEILPQGRSLSGKVRSLSFKGQEGYGSPGGSPATVLPDKYAVRTKSPSPNP
jgi:hypothetical protein